MNIITNIAKNHDGQGDIDASITEQQEAERLLSKQAEKEQFKRDLEAATAQGSLIFDAKKRASVKNWIPQKTAKADNTLVGDAMLRAGLR